MPGDKSLTSPIFLEENQLIFSHHDFTLVEMRILFAVAFKIQETDPDFHWHDIYIHDLSEGGNLTGHGVYALFKNTLERIITKTIQIQKDEGHSTTYPVFAGVEYRNGKGYFKICVHPELKLLFLKQRQNLALQDLTHVLALPSTYSIRIYSLLKLCLRSKPKKCEITFSVEQLRQFFGIENKYSNYFDLKKHILLKAQHDLKEHTDICFEFTELKGYRGKTIVYLKINFSYKLKSFL